MFVPINISIHENFSMNENQAPPKPLFYSRLKVLFPVYFLIGNVHELGSKLSICCETPPNFGCVFLMLLSTHDFK
jgi:hypothetical protein